MQAHRRQSASPRLVVVSNRVPAPRPDGRKAPSGGLVAALRPALESAGRALWFGWSGERGDRDAAPCRTTSRGVEYATVPLSAAEHSGYYQDYCNRILWPLLHGLPDQAAPEAGAALQVYRSVNERFARALFPLLQPDDLVWVHDYHLIPFGLELRRLGWGGRLGYFHHTPIPESHVWDAIPGGGDLAEALGAYDVVGVQTERDASRLRTIAPAISGRVRAYPISIDPVRYRAAAARGDALAVPADGRTLYFGVDRLDYTKGIPQRIRAFQQALNRHPEMVEHARLLQWAAPSRAGIPEYHREHQAVLAAAEEAHRAFPDAVRVHVEGHPPHSVGAALREADVCLVTPLADGMNLVAKEYAALHSAANPGVLILSDGCGAAEELRDALLVAPGDVDAIAEAMWEAFRMPPEERRQRSQRLREVVDERTSREWRQAFVRDLRGAGRPAPPAVALEVPRPRITAPLGSELEDRVAARLRWFEEDETVPRTWARDHSLWQPTPDGVSDRLGWLEVDRLMAARAPGLQDFAARVEQEGYTTALLLGMGGSAIAPRVFAEVFSGQSGGLRLEVLDSTVPDAIRAVESRLDPGRTLFIASSKSGTTVETRCLLDYFWERYPDPRSFLAVTDPGSPLESLALQRGFRQVFLNPPDIGGRYSALSYYGLVPAALLGVDLPRLLGSAAVMRDACSQVAPATNPGARLGAALAEAALMGRDLLALRRGSEFPGFGAWLEQLIAESTGKGHAGILPVVGASVGEGLGLSPVDAVDLRELWTIAGASPGLDAADPYALGGEYFRWEFAVALAGRVLGINPFDQPDVEASKQATREILDAGAYGLDGDGGVAEEVLEGVEPGQYVAIHAYLPRSARTGERLRQLRRELATRCGVATTLEYGPSLLHSTGQYHKGGFRRGAFLQIADRATPDLAVPGRNYDFATLRDAQAEGDRRALQARGRRVARVTLEDARLAS